MWRFLAFCAAPASCQSSNDLAKDALSGTAVVGPGVTFTLTLSQDTFTGYGNDTFSAPLAANSLGQELSTLQTGDSLTELSPGGVLDATFNPVITGATFSFSAFGGTVTIPLQGPNLISATIDNIGTWNLSAAAAGTYVAINGGAYVSGLTTLNMINSAAFSYIRVGVGGPRIPAAERSGNHNRRD